MDDAMTPLDVYNASKKYLNSHRWGQRHYRSFDGYCCFIGAASEHLNISTAAVEKVFGSRITRKILTANDNAKTKKEAFSKIADILDIPEQYR